MVNLEKEKLWGAMLGVLQPDADVFISALKGVLRDIGQELERCRVDLGDAVDSNSEYQRLSHLYTSLGGVYFCLLGCNGMLSSVISDMLKGIDSEDNGKDSAL